MVKALKQNKLVLGQISKYTVEVENPGWKELQTQAINQYAKENDLEPEQVDMSDKDTY